MSNRGLLMAGDVMCQNIRRLIPDKVHCLLTLYKLHVSRSHRSVLHYECCEFDPHLAQHFGL